MLSSKILAVDSIDGTLYTLEILGSSIVVTDGYQTDYLNSRFELESTQLPRGKNIEHMISALRLLQDNNVIKK